MATCPNCEALDLEVDEYELEEGDIVTCSECGASLLVASISPLELELVDDEDDDDDDEDEDDEDGDDGDDDLDVKEEDDEREDLDE